MNRELKSQWRLGLICGISIGILIGMSIAKVIGLE